MLETRQRHHGVVPGHPLDRREQREQPLAREAGGCLWVLVAESDPLGGIVLKRRIAERIREQHAGAEPLEVSVGLASFPQDGSSVETLLAAARLRALSDLDLEYVEQPLAAGDLAGMAALAWQTAIPIAADEDATDAEAVSRIAAAAPGGPA